MQSFVQAKRGSDDKQTNKKQGKRPSFRLSEGDVVAADTARAPGLLALPRSPTQEEAGRGLLRVPGGRAAEPEPRTPPQRVEAPALTDTTRHTPP